MGFVCQEYFLSRGEEPKPQAEHRLLLMWYDLRPHRRHLVTRVFM